MFDREPLADVVEATEATECAGLDDVIGGVGLESGLVAGAAQTGGARLSQAGDSAP